MKINEKLIENLFNHKIRLKKEEDKIALSEYEEFIPMYDIYTFRIYPIYKNDLFNKLSEESYRFIDYQLKEHIKYILLRYKNKYDLSKDKTKKTQLLFLLKRFSDMLNLIDNYIIEILTGTAYKVLFENSNIDKNILYDLSISICKRNSFHQFIKYIKPYYTKLELIKLGQNMNIIPKKGKEEDLLNKSNEFDVCNLINLNDINFTEIKSHSINIEKNSKINDITFYSYIGASLLNNFLRSSPQLKILNKFYFDRLKNMVSLMKKSPALKKDYQIYRFVSNDKFLKNKKIGETFVDNGFLSTTRNPFYSAGLNGTFGLILVKINLKKNVKGLGLFIEHFSLFSKEEEFLLPPFTKLKVISKNNKFKYYHTNAEFEAKIYKKYELEFVGLDYSWIKKIKIQEEPIQELTSNIFDTITNKYSQIKINNLIFNYYVFDGTGSYRKFYYNKIENGILLIHFDSFGYPALVLELGEDLVVNHINQYYFYSKKENKVDEDKVIEIILKIGEMFNYKKALIFHKYENFSKFKSKYWESQEIFLSMNLYNHTLYNYLKYKERPFKSEKNYEDNFKKIDLLMKKSIPKEIRELKELIKMKGTTLKELFIEIIENHFEQYTKFINYLNINELNYGEFNIYNKLNKVTNKIKVNFKNDDIYNLIYRPDFDRII